MEHDLSEFLEMNGKPGAKCSWGKRVQDLSDVQQAALAQAMDSPDVQHAAIYRVLEKWGVSLNKDIVARHRRGECESCR